MKPRTLQVTLASIVIGFAMWSLAAADSGNARTAGGDQFFIISSVDVSKKQLVLKRPTEVTELMAITDSTVFTDEQGKPLQFKELRAGDTVYVVSAVRAGGPPVVLRIRRAPMTVEELHRRYLAAGASQ